jgi:hypothetical protein
MKENLKFDAQSRVGAKKHPLLSNLYILGFMVRTRFYCGEFCLSTHSKTNSTRGKLPKIYGGFDSVSLRGRKSFPASMQNSFPRSTASSLLGCSGTKPLAPWLNIRYSFFVSAEGFITVVSP